MYIYCPIEFTFNGIKTTQAGIFFHMRSAPSLESSRHFFRERGQRICGSSFHEPMCAHARTQTAALSDSRDHILLPHQVAVIWHLKTPVFVFLRGLIFRRHHATQLGIYVMQISFQPASFHLANAVVLLADVAKVAPRFAASALLGTRRAPQHILEHVARFLLQLVVVVRAPEGSAGPLQVPGVAWFLFVEPRIINLPLIGCRMADKWVEALEVLIERDEAWHGGGGEVGRNVGTVQGDGVRFGSSRGG